MDGARKKELEAAVALGETSLWIFALAEEAADLSEISHLTRVLSEEVGAFLEDSSQAVPLSARRALEALEARAAEIEGNRHIIPGGMPLLLSGSPARDRGLTAEHPRPRPARRVGVPSQHTPEPRQFVLQVG